MAFHIELLYSATSVEQLEKAMKLNPDINCIHGIYRAKALRILLTSGYCKDEQAYPYTPLRIDSADEFYQMVEMHLKAGADTEYCIDIVLWTSHSFEIKKRLITLLMDHGAKTKIPEVHWNITIKIYSHILNIILSVSIGRLFHQIPMTELWITY
jgi:hypothetical protein